MSRDRTVKRDYYVKKVIYAGKQSAALIMSFFALIGTVDANPVLSNVASGNVTVQQSPGVTQVNQSSQSAIINWNSFNIGANEATHFQQPTGGVALNRINPQQGASQIFGQLTATGKIILVNQAGIFFGPGARVDVGGIIASTSDISNQNFLAGKYVFDQPSSFAGSAIINKGMITAATHGLVALLGTTVRNDGLVQAELGNIVLASGDKFTVSFAGDNLINFSVDAPATNASVVNTGSVIADGGSILMTAQAAQGVVDNVIDMQGIVEANSVSQQNGEIILDGGDAGNVNVSGTLSATGLAAGQTGGTVKILGQNVAVQSPAVVNVSGDAGGGKILVGGNFHGEGPEQNALSTFIGSGSFLLADAISQGNGGQIAVWSNDSTGFHGTISAQGGAQGGNGGYVETSGGYLDITGSSVNTFAPHGKIGTWLLDPTDVTIEDNGGSDVNESLSGGVYDPTTGAATSIIDVNNLETALNLNNVQVTTSSSGGSNGDIEIDSIINWSSTNTLTLTADRYIYFNGGGTGISASSGGVVFSAVNNGNPSIGAGSIAGGIPPTTLTNTTGSISVANFELAQGQFLENSATLPDFTVSNNFKIDSGTAYNNAFNAEFTRLAGTTTISTVVYNVVPDEFGLQGIATGDLTANYALTGTIDASSTINWNSGAGFVPIGNISSQFTGIFEGQNNTINNLMIYLPSTTEVGLFGAASNAQLQNVALNNFNVTGKTNVGTLIGDLNGGTVNNITASGTLTAGQNGGGLIGSVLASGGNPISISNLSTNVAVVGNSTVSGAFGAVLGGVIGAADSADITSSITMNNLSSHGPVSSLSTNANSLGGLIGNMISSAAVTLQNSFSTSAVTAGESNSMGGLVGGVSGSSASVSNSYSTGTVTGGNISGGIGGLVGQLNGGGSISDSYSTSTVLGNNAVGGLVGSTDTNSSNSITNSYSEGSVTGVVEVGGLIGSMSGGTVQDSYSGASVSGGALLGGFIGFANSGSTVTISTNYSSGAVSGNNAGFIGAVNGTVTLTNNFWDMDTSGQTNGGSVTGLTGLTTAQALQSANYLGWDISTSSGHTWYEEDGYTRPILQSEYSTSINTAHQLQLINLDPTASYQLAGNVDASGTSIASDVWGTSVGNGTGFDPIARGSSFTGTFNGNQNVINNLYMAPTDNVNTSYGLFSVLGSGGSISNVGIVNGTLTTNVGVAANLGLLVGFNNPGTTDNINNVFATGSISYNSTSGATNVGGLFGESINTNITNSYSNVNISNSSTDTGSNTGGLIGSYQGIADLLESYSTGSVTAAAGDVGGFVGLTSGGASSIVDAYSTGAVTLTGTGNVGGFMGVNSGGRGSFLQNDFWDTTTSNQNSSAGVGSGVTGLTTTQALQSSNYTSWTFGTTPSSGNWYMIDGLTRPILQSEYSTSINTAHQLQLMNLDLTASYKLTGNVDASNTAATDTTDVWAGNTFAPIGTDSTPTDISPFTGSLNGQFYTISNLNITSSAVYVGLIGAVGDGFSSIGSIQNLTLSNATINSTDTSDVQVYVGTVAGTVNSFNNNEVLMDNVSTVGGLVQSNNSTQNYDGGVIGYVGPNETGGGLIENVSNGAKVDLSPYTGTGFNGVEGGITAEADIATLINLSNSAQILGSQAFIGGIAGDLFTSSMSSSYNIGLIQSSSNSIEGGLVGIDNTSTISLSYNAGSILNSQGAGGGEFGGLVGELAGSTITNSYNLGAVVAPGSNIVGGLAASVDTANSTINTSYSTGYVTTGGGGTSGQLVGQISGVTLTDNNNFYDSDTAGAGEGGAVVGTALTNSQMMDFSNFAGFSASVWGSSTGETFPYLLALNPGGTPQVISGFMPVGPNNAVAVEMNGSKLSNSTSPSFLTTVGSAQTGNNGFFYLQENPTAIPFSDAFIIYLTSTIDPSGTPTRPSAVDNIFSVAQIPGSGSGTDGTTGFNVAANTILVSNNSGNQMGNADLYTALGNLGTTDSADFLFTVSTPSSGNADLTLGDSSNTTANLIVTANTDYVLNGNILTIDTSSVTFNDAVTISNSLGGSDAITTSGDQIFNGAITASAANISFNSGGNVLFNDIEAQGTVASLQVNAIGAVTLNSSIGTGGLISGFFPALQVFATSIAFNGSHVDLDNGLLSGSMTLNTPSIAFVAEGNGTGGIQLQGDINGTSSGVSAISFDGIGGIRVIGSIGSSVPLSTITGIVPLTLVNGGTYSTTGAQSYSAISDNGGTYNFDTTAGDVTFNGFVIGGGFTPADIVTNVGGGHVLHLGQGVTISTAFISGQPAGSITINNPLVLDGTFGSATQLIANGSINLEDVTSTNGANLTLTDSQGEGDTNFNVGNGTYTMNGGTFSVSAASGQTNDTITATSATQQTWNINGNNGNFDGGVITFTGMQNAVGSNHQDIFNFTGTGTLVVDGGTAGAAINTTAISGSENIALTGIGTNVGLAGTSNLGPASFNDINTFTAQNNASSSVTGITGTSETWTVTGSNAFSVASSSQSTSFSGFPTVVGSTGTNRFVFQSSGSLASVNGGSNGILDYSNYGSAISVNLQTGLATGISSGFTNMGQVVGDATSFGTLTGANVANAWTITGSNSGSSVTGLANGFSNISHLVGGTAGNDFAFQGGGVVASVDGGVGGVNALDYSGYGSAVSVNLQTATAPGVSSSFTNINKVMGDSSLFGTLIGSNSANSWTMTGVDAGSVSGLSNGFTNIANLVGGASADTFTFQNGSSVATVSGGAAGASIDTSALSGATNIALTATGSTVGLDGTSNVGMGSFNNISSFAANSNASNSVTGVTGTGETWTITGPSAFSFSAQSHAMNFSGFPGITGSAFGGFDTFNFASSAFGGTIHGGGHSNTFNFSNSVIGAAVVGGGDNTFNFSPNNNYSGSITSGNGTNAYSFGDNSTFTGTLTGGSGTSALLFRAYTSPITIAFSSVNSGTVLNNSSGTIVSFNNFNSATANETGASAYQGIIDMPTSGTSNVLQLSLAAANQGVVGSFNDPFTFGGFNNFVGQNSGIDTISFSGFSVPSSGGIVNGVPIFFSGFNSAPTPPAPTPTPTPNPNIIPAVNNVVTSAIYSQQFNNAPANNGNQSGVGSSSSGSSDSSSTSVSLVLPSAASTASNVNLILKQQNQTDAAISDNLTISQGAGCN